MFFFNKKKQSFNNLQESRLFDETSFYPSFIKDLTNCKREVIIESPFITSSRMGFLMPVFKNLLIRGVKIHIVTRDPAEHNENFRNEVTNEILDCAELDINVVLLKGNHHRKLAIVDRQILWEGSLNILSQCYSKEIMRRTDSRLATRAMFNFLNLEALML